MPLAEALKELKLKKQANKEMSALEAEALVRFIIIELADEFFKDLEKRGIELILEESKKIQSMVKDGERGDKGDMGGIGERGEKGDSGNKGDTGDKGNIGATGAQGKRGLRGLIGEKGIIGEKGLRGENGISDTINEIASKLNAKTKLLDLETIKDLPEILKALKENIRITKRHKLHGGGGVKLVDFESITSNITLNSSHYVVLCNATSGNITVTLPASVNNARRVYHIKKTDSSSNTVIIDGNASETIDDGTTATLTTQYESIKIVCDGSNWQIL